MKNFILLLHSIILFFCISCENEIAFSQQDSQSKLIMNAMLLTDSEFNFVYFNLSGAQSVENPQDAEVRLIVNGDEKEVIPAYESGPGNQCRSYLSTPIKAGDHIRLEGTAEKGKYTVSSETTVLPPIEPFTVDTATVYIKDGGYTTKCIQFKIKLRDRKNETNFYRLSIGEGCYFSSSLPENWDPSECAVINREDLVLTEGHITPDNNDDNNFIDMTIPNEMNIFSDRLFKDSEYVMTVYCRARDYTWTTDKNGVIAGYRIHIESISKEVYRHYRALNCIQSDKYEPTIMEPVIFPQNVSGGLGFVCASSRRSLTIITDVKPPR